MQEVLGGADEPVGMKRTDSMSLIYAALILRSAGKPITPGNLSKVLAATGVRTDRREIDAFLSLLGQQHSATWDRDAACLPAGLLESGGASEPDCRAPCVYTVATGEPVLSKTAGMNGAVVFKPVGRSLVGVACEQTAAPCPSPERGPGNTLRQESDRGRDRKECVVQVTLNASVGSPARPEGCKGAMAGFTCLVEKGRAEALRATFCCHYADSVLAGRATGSGPARGFV